MQQRVGSWGPMVWVALACFLLGSASAQAVTLQSWATGARISSGNTTLVAAPSPPAPSGPDASTGILQAEGALVVPPGSLDAVAIAAYGLSNGTLAAGGAVAGSAHAPADARFFGLFGGASATYFDELTVTSSSLPPGTPVDVRFVLDLAFAADAQVGSGAVDGANFARALADVQVTANGVVEIDASANRLLHDLESGSLLQTGLFSGSQHAEFTTPTAVGSTFQVAMVVDADAVGAVRPNAGAPGVNGAAAAASFLALSFGAEAVGADATVTSALLGAEFPLAALASREVAEAALPANPLVVPEAGGLSWAVLLGIAVMAAHRCRG